MKKATKLIALLMCAAFLVSLLAGCEVGFGKSSSESSDSAASQADSQAASSTAASSAASSQGTGLSDISSAAASSEEETKQTITGTGDNTKLPYTMTLFDVEYTVGHSRVKELFDNSWGMDPEDWKDVDLEEKIEYKMTGGSYKTLDNNTTEVTISYKNLAETFATPEDCVISMMSFEGSPDGAIKKAGVKLFGGKVDLSQLTTFDEIDTAFKSVFSSFDKELIYDSDYITSYSYEAELPDGKVRVYASYYNEDKKMDSIEVTMDLNYDFTYTPD